MTPTRPAPRWALPRLMALVAVVGCGGRQPAGVSPPVVTVPDPLLLPVATPLQAPLTAAYDALHVPSLPAGASYLDPTTSVKIYKLTSANYPVASPHWGHDYSEGGDEVSLPYKGNTRAVLARQDGESGGPWWLIDFTPGVGVGNPRLLGGGLSPWINVSFTFSNNPATPYYAYVSNGTAIRRFDLRTMAEAPGDGWPLAERGATWLHQSENDGFFVWMRGANADTVVGYEPGTGTRKTYAHAGLNEPRIDRAGRYVGLSMDSPSNGLLVWDWSANAVLWGTGGDPAGAPQFAHVASLKHRWLGVNWGLSWPDEFSMFTASVPNSARNIGGPANGTLTYGDGNWIQSPADLNDQWALFSNYGELQPTGAPWLAPGGMILITANGQRRLLGHPYNTSSTYNYYSFPKFSPDGKYVLFTSDMDGSGRSDLFLAELPQSPRQP
jgi:WD40-like Beta Propeller Repeat